MSILILLQLSCNTTAAIVYSFQGKKKTIRIPGRWLLWIVISGRDIPLPFSKSFWNILILIDLPFTLVLDTILLPLTFPYYLYVESDRPGFKEWYYKKWKKRLYTFIAKNSSNDILRLTLKEKGGEYINNVSSA